MSREPVLHDRARDPVQRGVHVDVFQRGRLIVEPRTQFEQRHDAAVAADAAAGRRDHAGDRLEQRALAGAVRADDAQHGALIDVEGDVAERPQLAGVEDLPRQRNRKHPPDTVEPRLDAGRGGIHSRNPIPLAHALDKETFHYVFTAFETKLRPLSHICVRATAASQGPSLELTAFSSTSRRSSVSTGTP